MNKHAQAMGRIKTDKKAKSSRLNGKKGGRPKIRRTKVEVDKLAKLISVA